MSQRRYFNYADTMSLFVIVPMIVAIVLTYRPIELGSFILPGGIFFAALSFACADIVAEVYGYNYCKKIIFLLIIFELFASLAFYLVLSLPHPESFNNSGAYETVLGKSFYVVAANLVSTLSGYFLATKIITRLKVITNGRFFWSRSVLAAAVGELLYSIIWVIIAFSYNEAMSYNEKITLILSAWLYKLFFTALINVPATILVVWLKKKEPTYEPTVTEVSQNIDINKMLQKNLKTRG